MGVSGSLVGFRFFGYYDEISLTSVGSEMA